MAINFPVSLDSLVNNTDNVDDVMAVDVNDLNDIVEALEAKVGIDSSAVQASLDYKVNNFFATGRKLWLYENVAPTGWTIDGACADALLTVKGGANAYNVAGGNQAGTWTVTGLTKDAHTHSVPHDGWAPSSHVSPGSGDHITTNAATYVDAYEREPNGDNVSGAQSGSGISSNATWRPLAQVGIIVAKD